MDLDIFISPNKLIAFLAIYGVVALLGDGVKGMRWWDRFRRRDD